VVDVKMTPNNMPARRPVKIESDVVYSTQTGDVPPPVFSGIVIDDPHCFVCGRHTDHFAEHDDMVEAGTALYGPDGSVYRAERA
jgi:hypothetical protein